MAPRLPHNEVIFSILPRDWRVKWPTAWQFVADGCIAWFFHFASTVNHSETRRLAAESIQIEQK